MFVLIIFAVNWNLDMPTLADYIILDYDVYKGVLDDMQVLQRCIGFLLVSYFSSFVFEFWFSGYRAFYLDILELGSFSMWSLN